MCVGEEDREVDVTGESGGEERVGMMSRKRWSHRGGGRGRMDGNREGGEGWSGGVGLRGMPGTGARGDPEGGGAGILERRSGKRGF